MGSETQPLLEATRRAKPVRSVAIVIATVFVVFACGNLRQDQEACEEAVAHLEECCPGFDSRQLDCDYDRGCASTVDGRVSETFPAIDASESKCIRDRACADLVSSGICARAQQADRASSPNGGTPVCP